MTDNNFVTLEAWISDCGDGSSCICWFFPGTGPDEDSDEYDFERWATNEGSGQSVDVRRGSSQHKEAWITANAPDGETFFDSEASEDTENISLLISKNWTYTEHVSGNNKYYSFEPPVNWMNM